MYYICIKSCIKKQIQVIKSERERERERWERKRKREKGGGGADRVAAGPSSNPIRKGA